MESPGCPSCLLPSSSGEYGASSGAVAPKAVGPLVAFLPPLRARQYSPEAPKPQVRCGEPQAWVPQVRSKPHLPPQVPSPRGDDHPSSLCSFPFILSRKKPVSVKLCAYRRKTFCKCHPTRVYKQEAERAFGLER